MTDSKLTDPSALANLSRPERLDALASSGLVRKWKPGDTGDDLWVIDGEFRPNNHRDGWTTPFPQHLLSASGVVGADAKEVLLSKNRLVLDGDKTKTLSFLESLGDAVKHIRALDIAFPAYEVQNWTK